MSCLKNSEWFEAILEREAEMLMDDNSELDWDDALEQALEAANIAAAEYIAEEGDYQGHARREEW